MYEKKIEFLKCEGMTLVELLIAMISLIIVIGGLVTVFITQSKMSVSEEELLHLQMNLRTASDRISYALSHAGFGCYDSFDDGFTMSGNDPNGGTITISSFVSNISNNNSNSTSTNSDSVVITYGFNNIATVTSMDNDNNVVEFSNTGPSITTGNDFKRYLSFFPNFSGNEFRTVTSISGDSYALNSSPSTINAADVFMVSPVRIFLSNDMLYLQFFAYQSVAVEREQYWIVAENIEDLQFQYSIDGKKWFDSVGSSDLQSIRKVRFWMLGRSQNQTGVESQVFEISDHNDYIGSTNSTCIQAYSDSINCVMYRVGPFNDGYTRMLSRGEVVLRNVY